MTCHPKDAHVLAAAVHARARTIITTNLKDFPIAATQPHGVVAISPDEFTLALFHDSPELVIQALVTRAAEHRRPARTLYQFIDALHHPQRLPQCAANIRRRLEQTGPG
jgi:hypothetical protein